MKILRKMKIPFCGQRFHKNLIKFHLKMSFRPIRWKSFQVEAVPLSLSLSQSSVEKTKCFLRIFCHLKIFFLFFSSCWRFSLTMWFYRKKFNIFMKLLISFFRHHRPWTFILLFVCACVRVFAFCWFEWMNVVHTINWHVPSNEVSLTQIIQLCALNEFRFERKKKKRTERRRRRKVGKIDKRHRRQQKKA